MISAFLREFFMMKISRMADYALLVVFKMRGCEELITLDRLCALTTLSLPTVRKLMSALTHSNLVKSVRGPRGGYKLMSQPGQISIAEIIEAIDGPMILTECTKLDGGNCQIESNCELKGNWNIINRLISSTLHNITLEEMGSMPINVERLKSILIKVYDQHEEQSMLTKVYNQNEEVINN